MTRDGIKSVVNGPETFTVSTTVQRKYSNTKVVSGIDAEFLRKQYFHDDIYDFYFFDGENLKEFFSPGREKDIKRSIYNISQVSLLENVLDHVGKLISRYTHELGKASPDIEKIQAAKEDKEHTLRQNQEASNSAKDEIVKLEGERLQIDKKLKQFKPIADLQSERADLEKEAEKIRSQRDDLSNKRSSFIRRYTVLIKLYPRMQSILKYISDKEANGELPPSIDITQVKQLLNMLDSDLDRPCPCPMCNHEIGKTGREHLERLLAKATVSSETSNFLKEIKGTLQEAVEEVKEYRRIREDISKEENTIEEDERRVAGRLGEIASILINYENSAEEENKKINVPELEARRIEINRQIGIHNRTIGAADSVIGLCKEEIEKKEKELLEAEAKLKQTGKTQQQLSTVNMLRQYYTKILTSITGSIRDEIETTTRQIFNTMNWKTKTFGSMEIDDDYSVSVYDPNGLVMTASLSATEQMALAYAFILAIHNASGRNCPLVIDSPIGRSSDRNRECIAEALLKISKEKQIIMLFTPDDYTVPVRELYADKAYIRSLKLSEDEKFVEGIEK